MTSRQAWRRLLAAESALRTATPSTYCALEQVAQHARRSFSAALRRASA